MGGPPVSRVARGILLAGRWQEGCAGDRAILETLTGLNYDDLREALGSFAARKDPFIAAVDRTWSLVSPFDAWILLGPSLFEDDLRRAYEAVSQVLSERDPAIDLPVGERWRAPLEGKSRAYSADLRTGLAESLALLGVQGDGIDAGGGSSGAAWASYLVRGILESANDDPTCGMWASIADILPLLAEAAPDEFLEAVRRGVIGKEPGLARIFADTNDGGAFGSQSRHTGLLWALETVAWSEAHFGQSIDLLARMAEIDPEGRLGNRPFKSLIEIYCLWRPETAADMASRLKVLDAMRDRHGDIAWRLMLGLVPEFHGMHFPTYEPRFRDWQPTRQPMKTVGYFQSVSDLVQRLISDATSADRWSELLEKLPQLPPQDRGRVRAALHTALEGPAWRVDEAATLWEALRSLTALHRQHANADWALPEEELGLLDEILAAIEPADPVIQSAWLFADHMPDLGDHAQRQDFAAYEASLAERRREAVTEILRLRGLPDVLVMARRSPVPWAFGVALSDADADHYEDAILGLIVGI